MTDLALHGFAAGPGAWLQVAPHARFVPLVGHGPTPTLEPQSFEDEVQRLAAWASSFPAPRRLLGYSLGARLGLALLLAAPELFERAVLVSGSAGLAEESERQARRQADQRFIDLLEQQGLAAFIAVWQAQPVFSGQELLPAAVLGAQKEERLAHVPAALAHSLRILGLGAMPWLGDRLGEVRADVLLLAGERDEKFRALAAWQLERLPRGRLAIVPRAGHNPLLENPDFVRAQLDPS